MLAEEKKPNTPIKIIIVYLKIILKISINFDILPVIKIEEKTESKRIEIARGNRTNFKTYEPVLTRKTEKDPKTEDVVVAPERVIKERRIGNKILIKENKSSTKEDITEEYVLSKDKHEIATKKEKMIFTVKFKSRYLSEEKNLNNKCNNEIIKREIKKRKYNLKLSKTIEFI